MKKISVVSLAVLFFVVLTIAPGSVSATGITHTLKKADIQFSKGNTLKASELLRNALVKVYNSSKLTIAKSVLISGEPAGFGMFKRKKNNIYRAGETVIIYVEPVGYHFRKVGNSYRFGLTADFAIQSEDGTILGGKNNFGSWGYSTTGRPLFDFYMVLTYNFNGIEPGRYVVLTTLHDRYGSLSVVIKTPISVVK